MKERDMLVGRIQRAFQAHQYCLNSQSEWGRKYWESVLNSLLGKHNSTEH